MPDLRWRGVERLVLLCSVDASAVGGGNDDGAIAADLCASIVRLAAPGAPVPITVEGHGCETSRRRGSMSLLVHASVLPAATAVAGAPGRLLGWTLRTRSAGLSRVDPFADGVPRPAPFNDTFDDEASPFGAAPRIAPYERGDNARLDGALVASLGEVLPWLRTPATGATLLDQPALLKRGYQE